MRQTREQKQSCEDSFTDWLVDELTILGEAFGEVLTAERQAIYARALSDISKDQLHGAILIAIKELKWFPKVAELRELAGVSYGIANDGRPGPEEAWARMPKGERMEEDSVVWCEEERAAYSACRPLLLEGDLIGARMAFKERYERELAQARSDSRAARWSISSGYDVEHRLITLATAVQENRINLDSALNLVPGERQEDFARMLPSAYTKGLLPGKVNKVPDLPGLPGMLVKMQMGGSLSEELKPEPRAFYPPSEMSEESLRRRKEQLKAQIDSLKNSRNGNGNGAASEKREPLPS